jgi:ABC-type phosphate transport system substrate-binding protein
LRTPVLILVLLLVSGFARADGKPFRVIVNPQNPRATIERRFLLEAFLKKRTRWGDDELIRPADLDSRSHVRGQFSKQILNRSVGAVKSYWQQVIFSGRGVPPPELASDDEVVTYVLRYPGAIGYVSSAVDLRGAKVIEVK